MVFPQHWRPTSDGVGELNQSYKNIERPPAIRHCRMFCGVLPKNVTFFPVQHSFFWIVSPKVVYSVYPAALFGAISAVFSGKHPAINKGRKRYIYFQEKIHITSRRESFIRIIPYISPPRYALWEILDNFTVVVFFNVSFLLKYSGLEHFCLSWAARVNNKQENISTLTKKTKQKYLQKA